MHLRSLIQIYLLLLLFKLKHQLILQHLINLPLLIFLLQVSQPNLIIIFIFSFQTCQIMIHVNLLMHQSLAYLHFPNSSILLFYQSLQVLGPQQLKQLPSLLLLLQQFLNVHHLLLTLQALLALLVLLLIILVPFKFFIQLLLLQLQAFLVIILLLLLPLQLFKYALHFHQQLGSLLLPFLSWLFLLLLFSLNIIFFLMVSFFQMVYLFVKVILLLLQLLLPN